MNFLIIIDHLQYRSSFKTEEEKTFPIVRIVFISLSFKASENYVVFFSEIS